MHYLATGADWQAESSPSAGNKFQHCTISNIVVTRTGTGGEGEVVQQAVRAGAEHRHGGQDGQGAHLDRDGDMDRRAVNLPDQ